MSAANVNLRRDHVGGAAFILIGALVHSMSDDLPFGTLASPGAGMMPKLVIAAMIAFGLILLARARASPALAAIAWDDNDKLSAVAAIVRHLLNMSVLLTFWTTLELIRRPCSLITIHSPLDDSQFIGQSTGRATQWALFPYLVQLAYFNCYFDVVPSFGQLDQKRQQWHHNY